MNIYQIWINTFQKCKFIFLLKFSKFLQDLGTVDILICWDHLTASSQIRVFQIAEILKVVVVFFTGSGNLILAVQIQLSD